MKRVLILIVLPLIVAKCGLAQQFSSPLRVNIDESLIASRNPVMNIDRQGNIYVTWIKKNSLVEMGPVFFSYSNDKGVTFSLPTSVSASANAYCEHEQSPEFAIDSKGYIHLVWSAQRTNTQFDIWYSKSFDHGLNWSIPISICDADDSSIYFQDYPSIAIDSSDNIYVSFLDARATQRKQTQTMQLFVARSTDQGDTWSKNVRADAFANPAYGTCESARQKIVATKQGDVFIAFRSNVVNSRDIYLARSYDHGVTFDEPLKIQNSYWISVPCPFTGPSLSLDRFGGAHISWFDQRTQETGRGHSYYAFVPYGSGDTPPNIVLDQSLLATPYTSVVSEFSAPSFRAFLYQTDLFGFRYQLYANDTLLIPDTTFVNGKDQKNASIAFGPDGTRYFVWQDSKRSAGNSDIYFSRETSPITVNSVRPELRSDQVTLWPQPASTSTSITIPGIAATEIILHDIMGREYHPSYSAHTGDTYSLDLSGIASGSYYITVKEKNSSIILAQKLLIQK